ncbi:MAG: formate--tetrahydrofolate ligase [Candidatus Omnitrophota bacterium]
MLSDLEIAQKAKIKPIEEIAGKLNISQEYLIPYGKFMAKLDLSIFEKIKNNPQGKYILVTAITPTPLGEGKTVTTIGLSMALNKLGKLTSTCIRQPSLGPVFGIKGGAAGGGYSQVLPMEDFNLHFTGDTHAIGLANNLAAAYLDNSIFKGNKLKINPDTIMWHRVIDASDRYLRNVKIGLGSEKDGIPRNSGFDITVASEVMAILALTNGLADLRKRLKRIVLAYDLEGKPVTCEDIKIAGAMAVLLRDAIKPNFIQTIDNTPCFVHAGPFANIAHGNSSIIADQIALRLSEFVVTEAGFGADCGAEKFFNIKCRTSGLVPNAVVLVCSVRALKAHSGKFKVVAGKPLDEGLTQENIPALEQGVCNLKKHIENLRLFGVPVVVAINKFAADTDKEIEFLIKKANEFGAEDCVLSEVFSNGSSGGLELAKAVVSAAEKESNFDFLYPLDMPIKEKIKTIATKIYGASEVEYSPAAQEKISLFTKFGWDNLPICMAKTHLSLSHDPKLVGRPEGFTLPIRDIRASVGAGFLYPLCGQMQTMPGLPSHPAGENIDIDDQGRITGLF